MNMLLVLALVAGSGPCVQSNVGDTTLCASPETLAPYYGKSGTEIRWDFRYATARVTVKRGGLNVGYGYFAAGYFEFARWDGSRKFAMKRVLTTRGWSWRVLRDNKIAGYIDEVNPNPAATLPPIIPPEVIEDWVWDIINGLRAGPTQACNDATWDAAMVGLPYAVTFYTRNIGGILIGFPGFVKVWNTQLEACQTGFTIPWIDALPGTP